MKKLAERMKTLIASNTVELKKYKELEELTGITTATWRSWWNRGGAPSGEMIEAVSRIWPEYAFWLVTGISDSNHGHDRPDMSTSFRRRTAARDLFLARIAEGEWLEKNEFTREDQEQYLNVIEGRGMDDTVSTETKRKVETWLDHVLKIDHLQQIRDEQEVTLRKFEIDQIPELPF
ncbi:hypothetical protein LXA47_03650 [Massilia sp. P8910]|uniref:hypothetical protein n=1 Tax=Massilia antarctica TaxID=2765360 RepID=UPI001E489DB9|nr:hypothetical protein [Massilia antarctica]MCE3602699.1 hypothetical protein [Massilia antarctica]